MKNKATFIDTTNCKKVNNSMTLKRDLWTNDEVIDIIEGLMIPIKMDDAKSWSQEKYDNASNWNTSLRMAASQFQDFKAKPDARVAKALDTTTGQIVVISKPLPQ